MTCTNRRQRSKWIIWLFPWAGRPASLHNSSLIPIAPPSMSEGFSRVSSKGVIFTHTTGPGNTSSRWFLDWIKNTFFLLKNSNGLSSKAFSAWLIQDDKSLKGSSPPISWRIYFDGCWPPLCAHCEFSSAFPFIFLPWRNKFFVFPGRDGNDWHEWGGSWADDEGTRPKTRKQQPQFLVVDCRSAHPFHLLAATRKCRWILHELVMRRQRWHFAYNCRCLRDATAHALISLNKKSIPAILVGLHTHKFFDISDVRSSNILDGRWKLGRKSHWKLIKSRSSQKLDVQAGLSFS